MRLADLPNVYLESFGFIPSRRSSPQRSPDRSWPWCRPWIGARLQAGQRGSRGSSPSGRSRDCTSVPCRGDPTERGEIAVRQDGGFHLLGVVDEYSNKGGESGHGRPVLLGPPCVIVIVAAQGIDRDHGHEPLMLPGRQVPRTLRHRGRVAAVEDGIQRDPVAGSRASNSSRKSTMPCSYASSTGPGWNVPSVAGAQQRCWSPPCTIRYGTGRRIPWHRRCPG